MKSLILLVFVSLSFGVIFGQEKNVEPAKNVETAKLSAGGSGGVGVGVGGGEAAKFVPLGDDKMKLHSIKTSTKSLFDSMQQRDIATTMLHVDRHSMFLFNTLLPANGFYQGKRGFMLLFSHLMRTASLSNADYQILFADEARGTSMVLYTASGVFRHNNVKFENIKWIICLKWNLGKINKMNIVEMNTEKIYSLFMTKAEKQWHRMMDTMYNFGVNEEQLKQYLAEDITISFSNIYPVSLLVDDKGGVSQQNVSAIKQGNATIPGGQQQAGGQGQQAGGQGQQQKVGGQQNEQAEQQAGGQQVGGQQTGGQQVGGQGVAAIQEGKDMSITLKGINHAIAFAKFADKTYFTVTSDIRVLYSDDSTVVAAKILKPTQQFFAPVNKEAYWRSVTIMYTINKFNDKGLLNEVTILLNRPFLPHQIRQMNQMLTQSGSSLYSLLAPLRSAFQVGEAKQITGAAKNPIAA